MDTNAERSGLQQKTLDFRVTSAALSLLLLFVWIYEFYIVYLSIYIILKQKHIASAPRHTWPPVYLYP